MCGEHLVDDMTLAANRGSSPRVRGALRDNDWDVFAVGIIPACAGSTLAPLLYRTTLRDHPRMCGEHSVFG